MPPAGAPKQASRSVNRSGREAPFSQTRRCEGRKNQQGEVEVVGPASTSMLITPTLINECKSGGNLYPTPTGK